MRRFAAIVVLIVALSACGGGSSSTGLPDVELERLGTDGTYAVAGPGEPRALNLWATWCAPCRAELPAFDAVAARTDDVAIIGVNVGDTGEDAADLVAELGLSFDQVLDPNAAIQRTLKITGMPATIFVDESGEILQVHNGELTEAELEALLDELY